MKPNSILDVLLSAGVILLILVGLPVLLLKGVDLGRSLRRKPSPSRTEAAAGRLLAVLQTVLAVLAFGIGLMIIGWVTYVTATRGVSRPAEWLLSLSVGVFMTLVGIKWFRQVFPRRDRSVRSSSTKGIRSNR